jgi:putative ABC transport system permease protein
MLRLESLALRNLRARPARTLLTLAGIVLGVAVILAINVTNQSTLASISAVFDEASGKAHLVIEPASSSSGGFDRSVLNRVHLVPGVQLAVPSIRVRTMPADEADRWRIEILLGGSTTNELLLYGIDPALDHQARTYELEAGRFLDHDGAAYQVVLVGDYAREHHVQVGKDLVVMTPDGTERLRVVGLMQKRGPGRLNNGNFGVVPLEAAQRIWSRGRNLDQIDVVATPDAAATADGLAALKQRLAERLGAGYSVVYPAERGQLITRMLSAYQQGLGFFSLIALFVGAFLIYNTFSMTVVERTREIGLLRALGMTRRQILQLILTEAVILGGVGSMAGVFGGIVLARGLIRFLSGLVSTQVTETAIPIEGLLVSLAVGGLVTLVAALYPAWQASRISPLAALTARARTEPGALLRYGWLPGLVLIVLAYLALYVIPLRREVQYPVGSVAILGMFLGATLVVPATIDLLERLIRPLNVWVYGAQGRIGSANIRRAAGRTALTVAALMVGVAMILGINGVTESFRRDLLSWVDTAIGGDLYVRSPQPLPVDMWRRLEQVEGVAVASPLRYLQVRLSHFNDTLVYVALDPDSYDRVGSFQFTDGHSDDQVRLARLKQGGAVFISSVVADKYGLAQGDTAWIETARGAQPFEVAGVVIDFTNNGYVIDGTREDMRRYFGLNDVQGFVVKVAPGTDPQVVAQRIDADYGRRRHLNVESGESFKRRVLALADQAFALLSVLALIGLVVAALGVINTLTMNVLERQREIGMLRAQGMTRRQVAEMVLAEAGTVGVIGGTFGIVFGFFMSRVFVLATNVLAGYVIDYAFPLTGLIASVVVALGVSQVAALYPARRAAAVNIVEAVQHE